MPRSSQLARLLQALIFGVGLAAVGWLAWNWPIVPVRAVLGALLLVAIGPVVLGIEFLLLGLLGGSRQVPAPGWGQLARAWVAESVDFFQVFQWRQPFRWNEVDDFLPAQVSGRSGIVLVHGFMCNRGIWTPWMKELQRRGVPYVALNLEPVFATIDDYVPLVEAAVARVEQATGKRPLVVCHSMGGLAVRAWLRATRDAQRLRHLVTIASPHAGTWLARFSQMPNGRQMRRGSAWLRQLAADEAALPAPWPPATCWYSNCDNIVFPAETAMLPGADNRLVAGAAHVELVFRAPILAHVLALLEPEPVPAASA
jgi:triacylglycerol lipase